MSARDLPNGHASRFVRDTEQTRKRTLQLEAAFPWRPPWTAWSPTITNMSYGSGSGSFVFRQIDDEIQCKVIIRFAGSGGVTATDPRFTLPRPTVTNLAPYTLLGNGSMFLNGTVYPAFAVLQNTSTTTSLIYGLNPSTSGFINLNSTTPNTWTNGYISLLFSYNIP